MDNKEFYAECVKRISAPIQTKVHNELVKIVLQNTFVDVENMFDDKDVAQLFKDNIVLGEAYSFIRDHQDLYVNPQWMNYDEINEILFDKNAINILNSRTFGREDSQLLLDNSIYRAKFDVIKYFMEKNVIPRVDTSLFLENVAKSSDFVEILHYFSSKEMNLSSICSGKLILTAALGNNVEGIKTIIKNAPEDMYSIRKALERYVNQEYEYKSSGIKIKAKFSDASKKMIPIVQILITKLSPNIFEDVMKKVKTDEMKAFLRSQYLETNLPNNTSSSLRMKI